MERFFAEITRDHVRRSTFKASLGMELTAYPADHDVRSGPSRGQGPPVGIFDEFAGAKQVSGHVI